MGYYNMNLLVRRWTMESSGRRKRSNQKVGDLHQNELASHAPFTSYAPVVKAPAIYYTLKSFPISNT
jgi:hypothetical protein